jgi:hypothetical protein
MPHFVKRDESSVYERLTIGIFAATNVIIGAILSERYSCCSGEVVCGGVCGGARGARLIEREHYVIHKVGDHIIGL